MLVMCYPQHCTAEDNNDKESDKIMVSRHLKSTKTMTSPSRSFTSLSQENLEKVNTLLKLVYMFCKKMVPKYSGLADFSTTCLPTM